MRPRQVVSGDKVLVHLDRSIGDAHLHGVTDPVLVEVTEARKALSEGSWRQPVLRSEVLRLGNGWCQPLLVHAQEGIMKIVDNRVREGMAVAQSNVMRSRRVARHNGQRVTWIHRKKTIRNH